MSTKFFNNDAGNTLFEKLKGVAQNMANFNRFLAVVGFFRSSGYFKLRKELNDVKEIKILVKDLDTLNTFINDVSNLSEVIDVERVIQ